MARHSMMGSRRRVTAAFAIVALLALSAALATLYSFVKPDVPRVEYREGQLTLRLLKIIEGPGEGPTPKFDHPLGVALAPDGTIYVSDTGNNRVCAFTSDGDLIREWGGFGIAKPLAGTKATWKPGLLNYPAGIDVGDDGLVYVADFRNDQVCAFTQRGVFVRAFPDPSKVVGKGASGQDGTGIAVTDVIESGGHVYATDAYQVLVFDRQGQFLYQFGKPGTGPDDLDHPNGVAADRGGTVYVSDSNHLRVSARTLTGEALWTLARWPELGQRGTGEKTFGLPRGLTVSSDGLILVADAVRHELIVGDVKGNVLAALGKRGVGPGEFNFPADVDIVGQTVVVADKENDRVQVFALERVAGDSQSSGTTSTGS